MLITMVMCMYMICNCSYNKKKERNSKKQPATEAKSSRPFQYMLQLTNDEMHD
jgi:hypothetical protein